jgi:hypothetical protein
MRLRLSAPKRPGRRTRPQLECLEDRLLLHGGLDTLPLPALAPATAGSGPLLLPGGSGQPPAPPGPAGDPEPGGRHSPAPPPAAPPPTLAVPALSSNPGAPATLYLDFDGHYERWWGSCWLGLCPGGHDNVYNPVFSLDNDPTTFNSAELAVINQVWQRVAEDFAPFNLNVTTVNPGDFADRKALRVSIGGSWQTWYGANAGGVAQRGSFTDEDLVNTVFVFPQSLGNNAPSIADAVSHEAGHAFGLRHQVAFVNGAFQGYSNNGGSSAKAPLMGDSSNAARSTWWRGAYNYDWSNAGRLVPVIQDDMAVIAGPDNGFGYRPDDHGDDFAAATALAQDGSSVQGSGIIATTADVDFFSFRTSGGWATLQVDVAPVGANLDAKVELWQDTRVLVNGVVTPVRRLVVTADPADSLGVTITAQLGPGRYYLAVRSHGDYGDVGQYRVGGFVPNAPGADPAPLRLDARALSPGVVRVTAVVKNLGTAAYSSWPGATAVLYVNNHLGPGLPLWEAVAQQAFTSLQPGQEITLTSDMGYDGPERGGPFGTQQTAQSQYREFKLAVLLPVFGAVLPVNWDVLDGNLQNNELTRRVNLAALFPRQPTAPVPPGVPGPAPVPRAAPPLPPPVVVDAVFAGPAAATATPLSLPAVAPVRLHPAEDGAGGEALVSILLPALGRARERARQPPSGRCDGCYG